MTERSKPYIGLSGIVNPEQQAVLGDVFREQGLDDSRLLALGVKATHKTQMLDIENKYGREWYPVGDEFTDVLDQNESELHVAQVFIDPKLAKDEQYRDEFIARIYQRGRSWLNAVQFDMLPISEDDSLPEFINNLKSTTGLNVLLQVHGGLMESYQPKELAKILGGFAVDYVLLDSSHGQGIRLNINTLHPYIEAFYESDELSKAGIGIAGGLNAEVVVNDLPQIVKYYPDLSWDAEGQLHRRNENDKQPINLEDASGYLIASSDVLQEV